MCDEPVWFVHDPPRRCVSTDRTSRHGVIPAHNEESVIATTLETLLAQARSGEFDVIVVCNGCDDRTEEAARQFAGRGVRTFSSPVLSKVAALNLGDHHATTSTRVYIDADVKLSTKSLHRLLEALDDGALVAAHDRSWT